MIKNNQVDVRWFSGRDCIGVVRLNTGHEIKYYIGVAAGDSAEEDMQLIVDWGTSFPTSVGDVLFGIS